MDETEQLIIEELRKGNPKAYKHLYDHHYVALCQIAVNYVHDDFLAETIVSDVIIHLWEVRATLSITTSLRSYLAQSVRHRCLDYLGSNRVRRERPLSRMEISDLPVVRYLQSDDYPLGRLIDQELEKKVEAAISRLPKVSQRVFRLSRFEGKSNREIAEQLSISISTVKYHIGYALQHLHVDLRDYLLGLLLLVIQV